MSTFSNDTVIQEGKRWQDSGEHPGAVKAVVIHCILLTISLKIGESGGQQFYYCFH